jgi:hypothetical protein
MAIEPKRSPISDEERRRRVEAHVYARASVGLEGIVLSAKDEAHAERFINGEIDLAEFVSRNCALPGNPSHDSMSTNINLRDRQDAVANAIVNQRLEGLEPDAKVVLDLPRFTLEGDINEVLSSFKAWVDTGEVLLKE